METAIASLIILTSLVSFLIGKYHERFNWNKLIEKGVLPKPKK